MITSPTAESSSPTLWIWTRADATTSEALFEFDSYRPLYDVDIATVPATPIVVSLPPTAGPSGDALTAALEELARQLNAAHKSAGGRFSWYVLDVDHTSAHGKDVLAFAIMALDSPGEQPATVWLARAGCADAAPVPAVEQALTPEVLTAAEIATVRGVLPAEALARLCAAIDSAISLDLTSQHALLELADALQQTDTRTAHYLIMSGADIVSCTCGEDGKRDADRHHTFQKVAPGTVCPHCGWRVQAGAFPPLGWG